MNIIVWIESRAGEVKSSSIEALGVARHLADAAGGEVTGVLCEARLCRVDFHLGFGALASAEIMVATRQIIVVICS